MTTVSPASAQSSDAAPEPASTTRNGSGTSKPRRSTRVWTWPIVLMFLVVVPSLVHILSPYVLLDPSQARDQLFPTWPILHYDIIVTHAFTASLAVATVCLQMWPWLRRSYPTLHRRVGLVYVFVGVVPTTVVATGLKILQPFRDHSLQPGSGGLYLTAFLWFLTSVLGYLAARRHDWGKHRQWMTYSFALALTNLWSRPLALIVAGTGGDLEVFFEYVGWIPLLAHLAVAQWWLDRTSRSPWLFPSRVRRSTARTTADAELAAVVPGKGTEQ